ncbi:MAG: glycosyltransferase family 2 protein [Verrucomicrobiaceae bacterium]
MSRVAVLITCFNRRETTLACLRRIADQTDVEDLEVQVFLADDSSSDGTTSAVASEFPTVTILRGNGSLYWGGGMRLADTAAWATRPDFTLWLNDDVVLEPNALRQLVDDAESTDLRSLIVGAVQDPATGLVNYGGHIRTEKNRPLRTRIVPPNGALQPVDTMNGNVVLVPAEVRAALGTIDIAFSHNMGDMDYAFRAKAAGFCVQLVGSFVGTCATNTSKAGWKDPSVPLQQRLRQLVSPKGLPPREWLTFTRRHCGWRWPRYFLTPFVRSAICRWL